MKTLAIYLMCGPETPELAEAAVVGGADIVELGFPFSDPLADGPVIRRAGEQALAAFRRLAQTEGIIPALEPAHALAKALELDEELILVCLSGRGDKDLAEVLSQ